MRRRLGAWIILGLFLCLKLIEPQALIWAREAYWDWETRLIPRATMEEPVAQIAIDDRALANYGQWPWSRRVLARLALDLAQMGVRAIVFDFLLVEPDVRDPDGDLELAKAAEAVPILGGLALTEIPSSIPAAAAGFAVSGPEPRRLPHYAGALGPLPALAQSFAGWGALNEIAEERGIVRRVPMIFDAKGRSYPSLAAEALRAFLGADSYLLKTAGGSGEVALESSGAVVAIKIAGTRGARVIPTDAQGAMPLWLTRRPPADAISAADILDPGVEPARLAGRLAIIGVTATGLADFHVTAFGVRTGLDLLAQAVSQSLAGEFLGRPDWSDGAELALAAALGALVILILPRLGALAGFGLAAFCLSLLVGIALSVFTAAHWLFDPIFPGLCVFASFLAANLAAFVAAERERRFVRGAFARYLAPAVVAKLAADPARLVLGGERRCMSFLYTDIADFTRLTEQLGPEVLAPIVNGYFGGACEVILRHGGTICQFAGDTVLAFFNAPIDQNDHAKRALAAARDLDDFACDFRRRVGARGIDFGETRIGVHTGLAVVGNFGSKDRFQYSALGDSLNTAARLEGLNKYFGTRICTSAATLDGVEDSDVRALGRVRLRGKAAAVDVFELLCRGAGSEPFMRCYRAAFSRLRAGEAEAARRDFAACLALAPADGPSRFHLARLARGICDPSIIMQAK